MSSQRDFSHRRNYLRDEWWREELNQKRQTIISDEAVCWALAVWGIIALCFALAMAA